MGDLKDLKVFQLAFQQASEIYKFTLDFPKEELYSLTSQIRRSSRSVCANLSEGYRKRSYTAHFILKLTDMDAENQETMTWLDFIEDCKYLVPEQIEGLKARNKEIGRLIGYMIRHPEKFSNKS
jgi:four helix bundle protein